ncbi:hypothetical protein P5G51_001430 [Virgibacillus sp. 179-BFC.A HS]|uniref:Uncharacterized protein n=1 Tax=Tigheibacillus jepli TaxID=3035914 RepID=A0ABU5CEJ7_9BACI|nr:hypothetical protein [Virgibacillus sp. 179-BFC.A HS]MDY0404249.1 hypothetical protein [Virgibacillus sp. 179-BFC.A HS]
MKKSIYDIKEELRKSLDIERQNGVNYDDFMALANMAKEFLPYENVNKSEIENTWIDYRINNIEQNEYRYDPTLFHGFDEVVGEKNIIECINDRGVLGHSITVHIVMCPIILIIM